MRSPSPVLRSTAGLWYRSFLFECMNTLLSWVYPGLCRVPHRNATSRTDVSKVCICVGTCGSNLVERYSPFDDHVVERPSVTNTTGIPGKRRDVRSVSATECDLTRGSPLASSNTPSCTRRCLFLSTSCPRSHMGSQVPSHSVARSQLGIPGPGISKSC